MASLETTDIFRGAFYLCMGGDLESIRFRTNGRQIATFLFNGRDLVEYDKAYVNGHALVNPVQFREALNRLRDILFETLRKREAAMHADESPASPDGYAGTRRYENDRERENRAHQKRC